MPGARSAASSWRVGPIPLKTKSGLTFGFRPIAPRRSDRARRPLRTERRTGEHFIVDWRAVLVDVVTDVRKDRGESLTASHRRALGKTNPSCVSRWRKSADALVSSKAVAASRSRNSRSAIQSLRATADCKAIECAACSRATCASDRTLADTPGGPGRSLRPDQSRVSSLLPRGSAARRRIGPLRRALRPSRRVVCGDRRNAAQTPGAFPSVGCAAPQQPVRVDGCFGEAQPRGCVRLAFEQGRVAVYVKVSAMPDANSSANSRWVTSPLVSKARR